MGPGQRRRLVAMLVVVGLTTLGLVSWALRPSYATLYAEMSGQDASAVADYLREQKVPYRLTAQGTAIEVPQDRLYDLRLKTASQGLLGSGTVGLEIFDRGTLPGTDFANRVNLQRALQGELTRTITALNEVSSARVHLVLPEESLFGEPTPPRASVMVNLRGGRAGSLSQEQVAGVQVLVAQAVEGLAPEQVTVVDQHGRVLGGGQDQTGLTAAQQEAKARYESLLRQRLQGMMDSFVGPSKAIVQVEAQMVYETEEISSEQVQPGPVPGVVPTTQGTLRRDHVVKEDYSGGTGRVGGAAGVSSNVFGSTPSGTGGGGGQYSHSEETREYEFSRTTTKTTRPPGKVARLSVAVLVDESIEADERVIASVIQAASGYDASRGDTVEVRKALLEASKLAEEQLKDAEKEAAAQRRGQLLAQVSRYFGGLALAVVLGVFLLSASKQMRVAMERAGLGTGGNGGRGEAADFAHSATGTSGEQARGQAAPQALAPGDAGATTALPGDARGSQQATTASASPQEQMQEGLCRLARDNSPAFASQLRILLAGSATDQETGGPKGTGERGAPAARG